MNTLAPICFCWQKAGMGRRAAKTLVLHIGANKTGSSAIQEFLRLNAQALSGQGCAVAPSDLMIGGPVSGQHAPFLEHLRGDMAEGRKVVSERISLLMRNIPGGSKLVVSAENLSNLNGTHELFADVTQKHDVEVVLYIRRQDELLLSSWQQWGSKTSDDFWAWIVAAAGRRGNWRLTLELWEELVGRDHINVRIYNPERLNRHNVIADFVATLELADKISEFHMPEKTSNPSYSEAVLDFVMGNRLLFRDMHDSGVYDAIEALTGNRFHRNQRESIITHEERLALLQKYAAVNAWVKNRYFANFDGPLFPDPMPGDYDVIGRDTLTAQKWELTISLVYALWKQVENRP